MKLEQLYNEKGEKRPYLLGEDGREYFFYKDRTGYVVREINKDDVTEWYRVMKEECGKIRVQAKRRAFDIAAVKAKADQMAVEGSKERTMLLLNPAGELIGEADFTEKDLAKAKVEIFLKDQSLVVNKGCKITDVLKRLILNTALYDELWAESISGSLMRIA